MNSHKTSKFAKKIFPQKFSAIYAVFKYVKSTFEESVAGVMVCNRLVGWLQFTVS